MEQGGAPMGAYRERLGSLGDRQLKEEWGAVVEAEEWGRLAAVKHEMALRFMGQSKSQEGQRDARAYFWDKLLESAGGFGRLVAAREWAKAKYLYDQACMLAVFLEAPAELRQGLFGTTTDDGTYINGLFDRAGINKVMRECIVKNRLGFECMVYRAPGEIGYHGAKAAPGIRPERGMEKEGNPAWAQEAAGQ